MTNYKDKIKEVRNAIPIPMNEALELLKKHEGDVSKCVSEAKAHNIAYVCEQTGCHPLEAEKVYVAEKQDVNRTVSIIRENMYDAYYQPIVGMTKENIRFVFDWMYTVKQYDFVTALDFKQMNAVIDTLHNLESQTDLAAILREAKRTRDLLLKNADEMTNEEFIKQNTILDVHPASKKGIELFVQRETTLKEELLRHLRNLN